MKNSEVDNWSNLPKNIINNIGNYLNEYFRVPLRLVNKHWSIAITPLLFYSIKKYQKSDLDFKINNYANYIRFLDNNASGSMEVIKKIVKKANKIEALRWWSGTEECLTGLIDLLIKFKYIRSIILTDCEYDDGENGHKLNWDALIDILVEHPSLEALDICTGCTYLLPLFNSLPRTSIKQLVLSINSDQIEPSIKVINNSKRLKHLEITVTNPEYPEQFSNTAALVNPSELLLNNNLEYLRVLIYYYYFTETDSFKARLIKELLGILSNPNFLKLRYFEWHFWFPSVILEIDLFDEPIALKSPKWTNLTKLSLFAVDRYLMSYIVEQCPNLCELSFNSPFVLPYNHSSNTLSPLKHLTKLLFGGFKVELRDHYEIIKRLFPSVVTLSLYDTSVLSDNIALDAYYIPLLFPRLKSVIFETEDYKLDNLIDDWKGDLNWEELFISLDNTNQTLLKPLLKKLKKLNVLYLFSSSILIDLDKLNLEPSNLKIFSASASSIMGFGVRISSELKIKQTKTTRRSSV